MIYLELLLYLLLIVLLLMNKRIYSLISSIGTTEKAIILLAVIAMIFAQVHNKPEQTYPLTHWGMYATEYPAAIYHEYNIQLSDGSSMHYPFEQISFTSQKAFIRKMENLSKKKDKQLLQNTVKSLIRIFNESHSSTITKFSVVTVRFDLDNATDLYPATRTTFFEFKPPQAE